MNPIHCRPFTDNVVSSAHSKDPKATATTRYTILCLDPDAPARTNNFVSPVNHWSQNGLKSRSHAGASAEKINSEAPVLMPWRGKFHPSPSIRTVCHIQFIIANSIDIKVPALLSEQPSIATLSYSIESLPIKLSRLSINNLR